MTASSEAIHWNGASFGSIKVKFLLRKSFAYYFKKLSTNYLLLVLASKDGLRVISNAKACIRNCATHMTGILWVL